MRLRLLNASTARVYRYGFSDDQAFPLIGADDGGLLRASRSSPGSGSRPASAWMSARFAATSFAF